MPILSEKPYVVLQNFGLTKTQTELYLASLQHGILSVLELSKLTKINRQQIYQDAEKLVQLGLYNITRKQGRKYIPASPSRLVSLGKNKISVLEENLSALNSLVPVLESIPAKNKSKVTVKYYEGLDKIKEAYEHELEQSKNTEGLSLVGSLEHIYNYFPHQFWDKWNKKYIQDNNNSKMLVHYSQTAKEAAEHDLKYKRESKYLHQFPLKVNIDIFNNTVLIVSFEDEFAVWIDSGVLAHSYRILFQSLWGQAKSFK